MDNVGIIIQLDAYYMLMYNSYASAGVGEDWDELIYNPNLLDKKCTVSAVTSISKR